MNSLLSPDNIEYIANCCAILAFLGVTGYIVVRKVSNHMKSKGDGNSLAQTESGAISQPQYHLGRDAYFAPGVDAPSTSPTAAPANQQSTQPQNPGGNGNA